MNLPALTDPLRYQGLYVFDFGEWTSVGYTVDEVAALYESDSYRAGRAYKIVRAAPDGRLELRGVARERFELESGMFFLRRELDAARRDFDDLTALAEQSPPPTRAFVRLVDRGAEAVGGRFATVLIFPAEVEDEVSRWLLAAGYAGGDLVEGGVSHVTNFYEERAITLARQQLWSQSSGSSRSHDELMSAVRRAVQR